MSKLTKAPVRARLKQDYNVNLRINIKDQKFDNIQFNTKCQARNSAEIDDGLKKLLPGFSSAEIKKFYAINGDLMKWVKKNPKNKKLLFQDPIKALQVSKVKLDRSVLKKLSRVKKSNEKQAPILQGLNLKKVEFSVKKSILTKDFYDIKSQKIDK